MEERERQADLERNVENRATNLRLSPDSDMRRWAAPVGRGQMESVYSHDAGAPAASATATKVLFDHVYKNVSRRESTLPLEREDPRRVETEGVRWGETSFKNQERFDLAYQKYHSHSNIDELQLASKRGFSKPIIAVDEVTRGDERPEEHQPGCPLRETISSRRPGAIIESSSASSSVEPENIHSAMPAAYGLLSATAGATLTENFKTNVSLPSSPQRSCSSTSDGSSVFLEMAKRLHRLRLAAVSTNFDNIPSSILPGNSKAAESRTADTLEAPGDLKVDELQLSHPLSSTCDDHWLNGSLPLSQQPSAAASLSDVSISSFYRLPQTQIPGEADCSTHLRNSSSPLDKNKTWSSEPILTPNGVAKVGNGISDAQRSLESQCRGERDAAVTYRRQVESRTGFESMRPHENMISTSFSGCRGATQRTSANGLPADGDPAHGRFMGTRSWNCTPYEVEGLPSTSTSTETFLINSGPENGRFDSLERDDSNGAVASLPPLPPGVSKKTNRLKSLESKNGTGNIQPASRYARVGAATAVAATLPSSASRLMEAIGKHPSGDLDYAKLKSILRERKSYKRRLEREKAKREALEDLIVKINTPRLQSFSNSSSNASTIRSVPNRKELTVNGRSLADLNDIVISSLPSNSSDGNSTSSEDLFLIDQLIRQHLRMKQALIGQLGKQNATESSLNSEREHSDSRRSHVGASLGIGRQLPKLVPQNGDVDEDDIPIGGEAATGAAAPAGSTPPRSSRLINGAGNGCEPTYYENQLHPLASLPRSKSLDCSREKTADGLNGFIAKDALRLALDNSSTGGSENGRRLSPSERRRRRKWETGSSGSTSVTGIERPSGRPQLAPCSSRRMDTPNHTPRPSVAFFVPSNETQSTAPVNGIVDLKSVEQLQDAFRERQSVFLRRSTTRQDRIRAASDLRAEMSRQVRELAENVAAGRVRLEEASEKLLLYELPQPNAFPPLEMFRASKVKYEQLPETVARRNRIKKEADLATNRVLAKMFTQKMAYKRLSKNGKQTKQPLPATVPSSVLMPSNRSDVRVLSR